MKAMVQAPRDRAAPPEAHEGGAPARPKKRSAVQWAPRSLLGFESLAMSRPGDASEREADAVAQRLVQGLPASVGALPRVGVQRRCAACEASPAVPCATCGTREEEELPPVVQRRATGIRSTFLGVPFVPTDGGAPLPGEVRSTFGRLLGHDLSGVRVHTGAEAARSAEGLSAEAYTVGDDVVFAVGRYAPQTPRGRELLAHELAHVAQQRRGERRVQRQERDGGVPGVGAHWVSCTFNEMGGLDSRGAPDFNVDPEDRNCCTAESRRFISGWLDAARAMVRTAHAKLRDGSGTGELRMRPGWAEPSATEISVAMCSVRAAIERCFGSSDAVTTAQVLRVVAAMDRELNSSDVLDRIHCRWAHYAGGEGCTQNEGGYWLAGRRDITLCLSGTNNDLRIFTPASTNRVLVNRYRSGPADERLLSAHAILHEFAHMAGAHAPIVHGAYEREEAYMMYDEHPAGGNLVGSDGAPVQPTSPARQLESADPFAILVTILSRDAPASARCVSTLSHGPSVMGGVEVGGPARPTLALGYDFRVRWRQFVMAIGARADLFPADTASRLLRLGADLELQFALHPRLRLGMHGGYRFSLDGAGEVRPFGSNVGGSVRIPLRNPLGVSVFYNALRLFEGEPVIHQILLGVFLEF